MKIYPNIIIEHSDQNINAGIRVGISMSYPGPNIPSVLASNAVERAMFVKKFNEELDMSHFEKQLLKAGNYKKEFLYKLVEWMKNNIPGSNLTDEEMISLGLRLWAGCISAAKGLSDKDMNGPIDSKYRGELFSHIDSYAQEDSIFLSGVQAAPEYRKIMGQAIFLDGVPDNSIVRRYL